MTGAPEALPKLVIVVAVATNDVIGRDNDLPWTLPSDLRQFKATTMGRPMIMGRRTFDSIGRPLPGRTSIVVTRDPDFAVEGVIAVGSLTEAIERGRAIARRDGVGEVMITGGGQIYAEALPLADRIVLTRLDLAAEGTVRFPPIDPAVWQETARVAHPRGPKDDASFTVVTYERRRRQGG